MNIIPRFRDIDEHELQQHAFNLDAWGFTRIANFIDPETMSTVRNLLLDITSDRHFYNMPSKNSPRQIYDLPIYDKLFSDLLVAPAIKKLLIGVLNDPYYPAIPQDKPNYILAYFNARQSESEKLRLHIDSTIPVTGGKTWAAQVLYAIDDQTLTNGCTFIVPGSHRSGEYTNRSLEKVMPLEAKSGDIVVWDSRLWHGAHANTDGKSRWALVVTFFAWWAKQRSDFTRSLPENIYAALSDEQKQLLGFCSIPPKCTDIAVETRRGYDALLPTVADYWR